jgi:hypothetical protein
MPETLVVASLFDELHVEIGLTPQERFDEWHGENIHVFIELRRLALEWLDAGHDHCSIDLLFNVLRWQSGLRTKGDPYLLNNDFRAPYARMLAKNDPRLANCFEVRRSKYDEG